MNTVFGKEPAIVLGALAEVIKAVIPMFIIFGLIHWTAEQVAAVMLVVGVCVGFLNVVLTRSQTTPTPQVDSLIRTAVELPSGTPVATVKSIQETKEG